MSSSNLNEFMNILLSDLVSFNWIFLLKFTVTKRDCNTVPTTNQLYCFVL